MPSSNLLSSLVDLSCLGIDEVFHRFFLHDVFLLFLQSY